MAPRENLMRRAWPFSAAICIGLAGMTLVTYWPVMSCSFVNYDDVDYVILNHNVKACHSWAGWNYVWTSFICYNWHPLTMLSLGLDDDLWGLNPVGYHATNLAFHCANVLLLFLVLNRMTGCSIPSAGVAALFAVHPLHVESVAWVSERKDVLSTFFMLLSLRAYVAYTARPSFARYCLVALMMTLGLLSKPMLVTLPVLLLLLDFWPLGRASIGPNAQSSAPPERLNFSRLLGEKLPLFGLSLIDGIVTIFAQDTGGSGFMNIALSVRIAHLFDAYLWYLNKTLIPLNLTIFYPHPQNDISWPTVALGGLCIVGITLLTLRFMRSKPHLMFGWVWFLVSLLPVIGLLQVGTQAYADRYTYIPHIGLFVAVVWEAWTWAAATTMTRIVVSTAFIIAIACCAGLSHRQIGYWKNSESLWTHALEVNPDNGVAHLCLGGDEVVNQKYEQAVVHLERGLKLTIQNSATAYCDLARAQLALNRLDEAEQNLTECLKINPYHQVALEELCQLLFKRNRPREAARVAALFASFIPPGRVGNKPDFRVEIKTGMYHARQEDYRQAKQHFEKAAQLAPYSAIAFSNLANAQTQLNELQAAKQNFLKALELDPELFGAHHNLAVILEKEQDWEGARQHYAEAFRINPNDRQAKQCVERLSKR